MLNADRFAPPDSHPCGRIDRHSWPSVPECLRAFFPGTPERIFDN